MEKPGRASPDTFDTMKYQARGSPEPDNVTTTRTPFTVTSKNAVMLDRGDAIDLDIERPWMRGDIHEHACGRILRKEFRINAVDGGEHLHRCAIDGALKNVVEGGASGLLAAF